MQAVSREELLAVPATVDDPELSHLRKRYARDFKAAFEDALAELTPEDRNLWRLSLVDGLSIDEIGAAFAIHRATAARRLMRCRELIQEHTRGLLAERLKIGSVELRSIMGYIRSHLDLSIHRLLATEEEDHLASSKADGGARGTASRSRMKGEPGRKSRPSAKRGARRRA
jgi:RNA polymerase sigma-70 factor (ECF subfamily)